MEVSATQRLSVKLARLAVLITVLLGSLLSCLKISLDYLNESEAIDREVHALLHVTEQPASRIAYNIDYDLGQELTSGLLSSPGVTRAVLTDNFDKKLGQASRQPVSSQYRALSDFLFSGKRVYTQPLTVHDESMGSLTLEVDTFVYGKSFLRRAGISLMSGFTHALTMSLILLVVFHSQLTSPLKRIIRSISRQNPLQTDPKPLSCPSGHERDELGVLVAVTNQQFDNIALQIKQRQQAEQDLNDHLGNLEQTISERTSALKASNERLSSANQALEQARQQALETAQARTTFLANMSHEIRTPLNGLLGMLELAREGKLPPEQRQQLSIAHESGKMLMALLNDALDLSKFEAGQLQLEHLEFDPSLLAEEVTSLLSQNAKAKVELNCFISPSVPHLLWGDPTRFRQVLINLLSNALKFTEHGRVDLYLEYQKQQLQVVVRDTGIGISKNQQQRIFEPFTQATIGTSRQYGGTGLGLALTLRLCEAMGGQLALISEEGCGSEFMACLPLSISSQKQPLPVIPRQIVFIGDSKSALADWLRATTRQVSASFQCLNPSEDLSHADLIICDQAQQLESTRHIYPSALMLIGRYSDFVSAEQSQALQPFEQLASPLTRATLIQGLEHVFGLTANSSMSTEADKHANSHRGHILLVEDNSINQLVAQGMLNKLGYQVTLAANGLEGIEQLKQHSVDLILMDCNMPIMDGYDASRHIRQNQQWQDLPIIALTANAFNEERERCYNAGMNDHLAKPFRKEELVALLDKWLHKT